ncbi:Tektin-3 [Cryptotermes secundus]|uniref:Tektin n=1 Tax=Cryptotermes secundus TaxID=105785 RepID=A0A2J7RA16_9NEOP|nr:Tektin-3 [Cryptotermes secundus]
MSGTPKPTRTGNYYQTPRPLPWRPTVGYENVEVVPLPSQPVTNALVDPCYTPNCMATEPLRFPNLVTGFERNPAHAARTALYTRYTPYEWMQSNISHYNEADTNRNFSERLRGDAIRVIRQTDEKTATGQRESGRRLGERITDTTFWRNEISTELERMLAESNLLQDKRRDLEKAIQDTEAPLHISQECLYQRENRQGIDLVHDQVEQALLSEVENLRTCQDRLKNIHERTVQQLRNNRAAQHELERDLKSKESALGIDNMCHQLNNFSRGINYYGGIEKFDPTVNVPESWAENSNRIIQRSQTERSKSAQLRTDSDNLISQSANDIWNAWNATNSALSRRASEVLETKAKLQMHLHKIQQEIFDVEKHMELLRKAIMDKSNPLKVAHTRLEARAHRRDVELCRDCAQTRLVKEVQDIGDSIEHLQRKLQDAEAQHQHLLKTRSNLETELQIKVNSLFIDREKCLGMRRSFPINATIKY